MPKTPKEPQQPSTDEEELPDDELLNYSIIIPDEDRQDTHGIVLKIQKGRSKLDKTAAR